MTRPQDKHLDQAQLHVLIAKNCERGRELEMSFPELIQDLRQHLAACRECSFRAQESWFRLTNSTGLRRAAPQADCPEVIDWYEVVLGLWPEARTTQLLAHASVCDHCGPRLRAAARLEDAPTADEAQLLAQLKTPSKPATASEYWWRPRPQLLKWLTPVLAVVMVAMALTARLSLSSPHLSAQEFGEFAVATHRQHAQASLALDVRSDSQRVINEWVRAKAPFIVALPDRVPLASEQRPYRLEGARLLPIKAGSAIFIAYRVQTPASQTTAASLTVIPESFVVASGGVEAGFKKVTFHYSTLQGYKVVTWSQHGLTYALVSTEGNGTQRSCMVCHSAMRDRDLSETATPLPHIPSPLQPTLQ